MRFRNTVVAMVLLAALVGFIYYYEYRGEPQRDAAEQAAGNALTFERDKVRAIEIARAGAGTLTLSKVADGWSLAAPSLPQPTRADPEKVDSLLSALGFLHVERTMEEVPGTELDGFKLKEPPVRVTLRREEGQPDVSLSLGDKTPVGGFTYASRPGSSDVLLLSGGVDPVLGADLATLRYRKIVGVDVWKVSRFSIAKGDRMVTLAHGADPAQGEGWRLERPVAFPADSSKAQGLWFDLQSAEVEGFELEQPAGSDLARLGLDRPALTLSVERKEGAPPVTVAFGGTGPDGIRYARRSDMAAVMKVKQDIVGKLESAVSDIDELRDARVAPVDRFRLTEIEIQRAAGAATLVKDDASRWHWGGAEGAEMASEDVNGLIDAIEGARATGFLDQAAATAGAPALTITLREGGQGEARAVTVRVSGEGASPDAGRRVTSSVTPTVYVVPPAAIQTLIDRAAALKAPEPPPVASAPEGETK